MYHTKYEQSFKENTSIHTYMHTLFSSVVLKLFQEEAPLCRVNSFVAPPKENS